MRLPGVVVIVATLSVLAAAPASGQARLDMYGDESAAFLPIVWEGGSDVRTSNSSGTSSAVSSLGDLSRFRLHVSRTPADVEVWAAGLLITGRAIPDPDECTGVAPASVCDRIRMAAQHVYGDFSYEQWEVLGRTPAFAVYLDYDGPRGFRFSASALADMLQLVQTFDPAELHVGLALFVDAPGPTSQHRVSISTGSDTDLMVHMAGPDSGAVIVTPGGTCTPAAGPYCVFTVPQGAEVRMAAASPGGSVPGRFSEGTGVAAGCSLSTCSFTMSGGGDVTATFDETDGPTSTVTLTLTGDGTGSVAADGVTCEKPSASQPVLCQAVYLAGSQVTLRPSPGVGSGFAGYSSGTNQAAACGAAAQCSFTLTADSSVTVRFDAVPTITSHPTGVTVAPGQNAQFAVMATGASTTVRWQRSTDGGTSWTDLSNSPPYSGVTTTTLLITGATLALNGSRYRAVAINAAGSATSNAAVLAVVQPTLSLTPGTLNFAVVKSGTGVVRSRTSSQSVAFRQTGGAAVAWVAVPAHPWVVVNPSSGTGSAVVTVSIAGNDSLVPETGTFASTISIVAAGAASNPRVEITLSVFAEGASEEPFGSFDTPVDSSIVTGSIAVTGWALDDVEVTRVHIYREATASEGAGLVFIGDATFIEGARPDIEAYVPSSPRSRRAGWGYLLLTNFLPNQGDGTFRLYAYADDADGHSTLLGTKTITCANANATAPFGAIDTPRQGETIRGSAYANFGWALANGAARAHPPYGSVTVFVDGVPVGVPVGWVSRADLTTLFPVATYPGVTSALGVWTLDTTTLADGRHSIAWSVTDDNGRSAGIGSRYFWVDNATAGSTVFNLKAPLREHTPVVGSEALEAAPTPAGLDVQTVDALPEDAVAVRTRRGYDLAAPLQVLDRVAGGLVLHGEELDRFELLPESSSEDSGVSFTGHLRTPSGLMAPPIGSTLDARTGAFWWQPGPGFLGVYDLVLVRWVGSRPAGRRDVRIVIHPKGSTPIGPTVVIDTPAGTSRVMGPFLLAGWAIDADAPVTAGSGISTVHVWAYPVDCSGCDPLFVGVAEYGGARPDVAAALGAQFGRSGYGLIVDALPPGQYDLAVFAWSTALGRFAPATTVRVTVLGPSGPQ
jgi:hypothetical protein